MAPSDRIRVLLVDDNDAMLARAARVIAAQCDVVGAVTDGPSAVEAALVLDPEVIVLDVSMRGMTGFETARRLRGRGCRASIVFLSVHDGDEFIAAGQAAGALGYVFKGKLGADLVKAILEAHAGRPFVSASIT
jgi:DNA-binding NarL/FixJ family response regulator